MGLFRSSDADRAEEIRKKAESQPDAVSVSELRDLLGSSEAEARSDAALALESVVSSTDARIDPDDVRGLVDDLRSLLDDDAPDVRENASKALARVAGEYPGDVRGAVEDLQSLLDDDYPVVRRNGADALRRIATEYPGDVRGAVDDLHSLLGDDEATVRRDAAGALGFVAEEYPGDVRVAVGDLRPLLGDDDPDVRRNASLALAKVAREHPGAVRAAVATFQSLGDDEAAVRVHAALALAHVAREYPGDVRGAVGALHSLLSDDDHDGVRVNASLGLGAVAAEYPEEVGVAADDLAVLLRADDETIRERTADTLEAVVTAHPDSVASESTVEALGELLGDGVATDAAEATLRALRSRYPEHVDPVLERHVSETTDSGVNRPDASTPSDDWLSGKDEGRASRRTAERAVPDGIPSAPDVECEYDQLRIADQLGSGGNADVFRVTVPSADTATELAMKRPQMDGTLHSETAERLVHEAETWDRLDDHDHVVSVVDYGSDPFPWIAMEYMDGGHLAERTDEMGTGQALWTAIATAKAVRHAHSRGVVHLDLKPENVLFRSLEGAWDVPKVADWGLAKRLLDQPGAAGGLSPQYAAPEQFDDSDGPVDNRTDVYQLGVVFYELFTGELPFDGEPAGVASGAPADAPTPPSERADVPPELDEVVLEAMATDRRDRYEDVLLLRNDLQEVFGSL
jgi:hypothetical protein